MRSSMLVALAAYTVTVACQTPASGFGPPREDAAPPLAIDAGASLPADGGAPPSFNCVADCSTLIPLPEPREGAGYRSVSPPAYQFGRRELVQTLVAAAWHLRAEMPGLSDMGVADLSQQDGRIPGSDIGALRHPAPSHSAGFSVDLTYFRTGGKTLQDGPACPLNAAQTFCAGPHDLDIPANAHVMRLLAKSRRMVQLIVDPVMEPDLRAELAKYPTDPTVQFLLERLTSGVELHADHFHVSFSRQCFDGIDNDGDGVVDLDDPGCMDAVDDDEQGG